MLTNLSLPYCNVMEPLVAQEVQQQLQNLPPNILKYINSTDAIAFALNRLPPLYATSQQGWYLQQQRAKQQFQHQIVSTVAYALMTVLFEASKYGSLELSNYNPTEESQEAGQSI